jgi:hypothetical protein
MEDCYVPAFVIETNVFFKDLPIVQGLLALAPSMRLQLIIPLQVIQELKEIAKKSQPSVPIDGFSTTGGQYISSGGSKGTREPNQGMLVMRRF